MMSLLALLACVVPLPPACGPETATYRAVPRPPPRPPPPAAADPRHDRPRPPDTATTAPAAATNTTAPAATGGGTPQAIPVRLAALPGPDRLLRPGAEVERPPAHRAVA